MSVIESYIQTLFFTIPHLNQRCLNYASSKNINDAQSYNETKKINCVQINLGVQYISEICAINEDSFVRTYYMASKINFTMIAPSEVKSENNRISYLLLWKQILQILITKSKAKPNAESNTLEQ